jgi:hypothetical protein
MAGRINTDPLGKSAVTVYLSEARRQAIRMYMQSNELENPSQTIDELIQLGLGYAPQMVALASARYRGRVRVEKWLRTELSTFLRNLATQLEATPLEMDDLYETRGDT